MTSLENIVADAGLEAARRDFAQCGHLGGTRVQRVRTTGTENAARRRIDRTRDIALEKPPVAARVRVRPRGGFEQRFGVRMPGGPVQLLRGRDFYHLAEIEHDD